MDATREEDVDLVSSHDRTLLTLAEMLACSPALVYQTWHKLDLDSFDDPNEINNLKVAEGIYRSAFKTLNRLNQRLGLLPAEEHDRLIVERNPILEQMKAAALAFEELHAHRKSVIDRNPRKGNQDARADQVAELVALIFRAKVANGVTAQTLKMSAFISMEFEFDNTAPKSFIFGSNQQFVTHTTWLEIHFPAA